MELDEFFSALYGDTGYPEPSQEESVPDLSRMDADLP